MSNQKYYLLKANLYFVAALIMSHQDLTVWGVITLGCCYIMSLVSFLESRRAVEGEA